MVPRQISLGVGAALLWLALVTPSVLYLLPLLLHQEGLEDGPWEWVCVAQYVRGRKCVVAVGQVVEGGLYIIAIAQKAVGLIAFGQFAIGLVSVGQATVGVLFSLCMVGVNVGVIIGMVCVGATSPGCLVGFELVKLAWSRGLVRANVFDWSFGKQPKGERGGSADPEAPETDGLTMEEDQLLKGSVFPALISPYEMAGSSHLYQVPHPSMAASASFNSLEEALAYRPPAVTVPATGALEERLKELKNMREINMITEYEYRRRRAQMLREV